MITTSATAAPLDDDVQSLNEYAYSTISDGRRASGRPTEAGGEDVRLEDKVVVITGAGHGLGRDAAQLFADEGAKVVATDFLDTHGKSLAGAHAANGVE